MGIELARVHVAVRGDTAALRHDMRSARRIVDDSLHRTRSMGIRASTALRDTYGGMVAVLAPVAAIMDKMVFDSVKLASNFEMTKIAFETMMGSADAATSMLKSLSDFAVKTPFQIEDVEHGARQLMAVGFAAEEVLPNLKAIGDISAGIGRGQDGLQRLILNMGQVKAQTRLTGRELRDFAVLGVPLINELADMFGKTTGEIKDLVEAAAITSDHVSLAFERMTSAGGKFHDLTEKQAKTVMGLWSNLKDTITVKLRELGERINETFNLKGIIKSMMEFVDKITPAMAETLAWAAGFVTLAAAITGALFTMQALHIMLGYTFLGGTIAVAIIALSSAFGMWLVKNREAIVEFWKTNESLQELKRKALKLAETVRANLIAAWQRMLEIWEQIRPQVMAVLKAMGEVIGTVVGVNALTFALIALSKVIYTIGIRLAWITIKWTVMYAAIQLAVKGLTILVEKFFGSWSNLINAVWEELKVFFKWLVGDFETIMRGFDMIWNHWDYVWDTIVTQGLIKWTKFKDGFTRTVYTMRATIGGFIAGVVAGFKAMVDKVGNFFENMRDRLRISFLGIQAGYAQLMGFSPEAEDKAIDALEEMMKKRNEESSPMKAFADAYNKSYDELLAPGIDAYKDDLDGLEAHQKNINEKMSEHFKRQEEKKRKELLRTRRAALADDVMNVFLRKSKEKLDKVTKGYQFLGKEVKLALDTKRANDQLQSPGSLLKDTGGRVGFAELGTKIQDALLPKDNAQLDALKEGNTDRKKMVEFLGKLNPLTLFTLK